MLDSEQRATELQRPFYLVVVPVVAHNLQVCDGGCPSEARLGLGGRGRVRALGGHAVAMIALLRALNWNNDNKFPSYAYIQQAVVASDVY